MDLYDVGPVTFPAYEGADAGVRADDLGDVVERRNKWRAVGAANRKAVTAAVSEIAEREARDAQATGEGVTTKAMSEHRTRLEARLQELLADTAGREFLPRETREYETVSRESDSLTERIERNTRAAEVAQGDDLAARAAVLGGGRWGS